MIIEESSTITAKGQTTVPKTVRQALGVDYGGKIAYRIEEDGSITVHNPDAEHHDPALASFLGLVEADITAGKNVRDLPAGLAEALVRATDGVSVDLDEVLEGDVAL